MSLIFIFDLNKVYLKVNIDLHKLKDNMLKYIVETQLFKFQVSVGNKFS